MLCEASQAAAVHTLHVPRALAQHHHCAVFCGLRILRHPIVPRALQFPCAMEAARLLRC